MELLIRKIILAMEIDVVPGDDGAMAHRAEEFLPTLFAVGFRQLFREIEIIPANDGVFDQAAAPFGDLLLDFFPRQELLVIAKGHGAGKLIGIFGTFHERAKVVDSLSGYNSGIAGCRHNLTT